MGIQTMGSQSNCQHSLLQPSPLVRQNSWYSLTLDELGNLLGISAKSLGSMNLDELLNSVWSTESNPYLAVDTETISPSSSLQRQASITLARALSGRTVDQVWNEVQQGQKRRYCEEMKDCEREPKLGETTLEDFVVQAGLFVAETSLAPTMELDYTQQWLSQSQQVGLSPSPSIGTSSDTPMTGRKRDAPDTFDRSIDRRLRRKINNRESAARSRARKQAYHDELVNKVSRLEEDNLKFKREKEFDIKYQSETSEPKYQLRRTSSAFF